MVSGRAGGSPCELRDVVELDGRGTWRGDRHRGQGRDYRLQLVKEGGEWRISNPPDRLLIPRTHFDTQYQQYLLYFFDQSAQALVPEPVYVPRGRQAPTLLVASLLKGPEPDLRRTERTFFPRGTRLDGISVPVSRDGTAEVPLSDQVLDADDDQLNLLFAQLAWTLGQLPGVERMRVTVGGTPVDLPGSREDVGVDQWSEFDPAVAWASTALFGLRDRRVVTLSAARGEPGQRRVRDAAARASARSAVDLLAQHVAGVSGDGRGCWSPTGTGSPASRRDAADVRTVYRRHRPAPAGLRPLRAAVGGRPDPGRGPAVGGARRRRARGRRARASPARTWPASCSRRDGTRLVEPGAPRRPGPAGGLAGSQRDAKGRVRGLGGRAAAADRPGDAGIRDIGWRTPGSLAVLAGPTAVTSQVLDGQGRRLVDARGPQHGRGAVPGPGRARLVTSPATGTPLYISTATGRCSRWPPTAAGRDQHRAGAVAPTFVG